MHGTSTTDRTTGATIFGLFALALGLMVVAAAVALLFWNEGRTLRQSRDIEAARNAVIHAGVESIKPAHEGKLIHLSGKVGGAVKLEDNRLAFSAKGLRLRRKVEMYQWTEEERTAFDNGGQKHYTKVWSDEVIDTDDFESGYENPEQMPLPGKIYDAPTIRMGAYNLSDALVHQIDNFETAPLKPKHVEALRSELDQSVQLQGKRLYIGKDPTEPSIGDARVTMGVAKPVTASLLARQSGDQLKPWPTPEGRELKPFLEVGNDNADELLDELVKRNILKRWLFRGGGLVLMLFGSFLMAGPLTKDSGLLRGLGYIVAAGTFLIVSLALAVALSIGTIGIARLYYSDLWPVALLGGGALLIGLIVWKFRKRDARSQRAR